MIKILEPYPFTIIVHDLQHMMYSEKVQAGIVAPNKIRWLQTEYVSEWCFEVSLRSLSSIPTTTFAAFVTHHQHFLIKQAYQFKEESIGHSIGSGNRNCHHRFCILQYN
jgi:hypothetical protein